MTGSRARKNELPAQANEIQTQSIRSTRNKKTTSAQNCSPSKRETSTLKTRSMTSGEKSSVDSVSIIHKRCRTYDKSTEPSREKRRRIIQSESDESDSDNELHEVASSTGTESELNRLYETFHKIVNGDVNIHKNNPNCLMGCGRLKATVLLPCRHQSTCNECFVLSKLYLLKLKKKNSARSVNTMLNNI